MTLLTLALPLVGALLIGTAGIGLPRSPFSFPTTQ